MPNPMYEPYLDKFDEAARPIAEEVFREWDGNVTKKFQEIHNEYEPYKPLIDGYEADVLSAGVQLLEQLRDNPREVYDNIGKHYKWDSGPTNNSNGSGGSSGADISGAMDAVASGTNNQELETLKQQIGQLAELMNQQQLMSQQQSELQQFNQYLDALEEHYGEYDRDWVLGKIASGTDPEQAVQGYHEWYERVTGRSIANSHDDDYSSGAPAGPDSVLGQGGSTPNQAFDPTKLNSQQTQDFVSQYLSEQLSQGG